MDAVWQGGVMSGEGEGVRSGIVRECAGSGDISRTKGGRGVYFCSDWGEISRQDAMLDKCQIFLIIKS